ncbi:MAG: hypothetical protein EKK33_04385 [Bradyrhizobiaceae bacterium]|nr:MAG: hypothetical protein EKK33_04385 [Bradyrhizobiaceae bacterium]
MQRNDLLAFSLLVFSVVVLIAISIDPKGFSIKDWQPLMAAVIALVGAGTVFRGATLAYNAAIKKIDFDREVHQSQNDRRRLGVLLRARFVIFSFREKLILIQNSLRVEHAEPEQLDVSSFPGMQEAWEALEELPGNVPTEFSNLRTVAAVFDQLASRRPQSRKAEHPDHNLIALQGTVDEVIDVATRIFDAIEVELESIWKGGA